MGRFGSTRRVATSRGAIGSGVVTLPWIRAVYGCRTGHPTPKLVVAGAYGRIDVLRHLILPATTLALCLIDGDALIMRAIHAIRTPGPCCR